VMITWHIIKIVISNFEKNIDHIINLSDLN
jgi:hypothetical protein